MRSDSIRSKYLRGLLLLSAAMPAAAAAVRERGFVCVLLLSAAMPAAAAAQDAGGQAPASEQSEQAPPKSAAAGGEIVVTATRQAQFISKVPISISAYNQQAMDTKGMKSFSDVARFTPGVRFNPANNTISIRGISSGQGGAGTTGIYIDDTPIQIRGLGFNSDETLPAIFDLNRVEVLRGPQGTLFGAGSEGGTVRFITPQPSLTDFSTYNRAEVATIAHGGMNYEAGSAVGVPIIKGVLGLRVSAWHRRDGGYIDHVDNQTGLVDKKNINYGDTTVLRGSLAFQPTEGLMITPAMMYQRRDINAWDQIYVGISDPENGKFQTSSPETRGSKDKFILPSLNIRYDVGGISIVTNSSYFKRENETGYDGTIYYLSYFQHKDVYPGPYENNPLYPFLTSTGINKNLPYYIAPSHVYNKQRIHTEEIRFQSNNPDSKFTWVVGGFYQESKTSNSEQLESVPSNFFPVVFGVTEQEAFGYPTTDGNSYIKTTRGKDSQIAVFADVNYEIISGVKITGGLRYAETKFSFNSYEKSASSATANLSSGKTTEHPFTPKVGINYQVDNNNLVYATWAKGYRVGGANSPVNPVTCANDLNLLGLTKAPGSYGSDTVKSIEIGSKNKLFGNKLQFAGSIYQVKWNDIQQNVYLSSCGLQFIANLGAARSRGFDLQATLAPVARVTLDAAIGYNQARLTKTVSIGPGVTSARAGDAIEGAPWTISVGGQYQFPIGEHEAFVRADLQYLSRLNTPTSSRNPLNVSAYTPGAEAPSARTNISLRAGAAVGAANISVFVDNLLDSAPHFAYGPVDSQAALYTTSVARPRVIGLTVTYRQ